MTKRPQAATSGPYDVELVDSAEAVYKDLWRKAEKAKARNNPTNQHVTNLAAVDQAFEAIAKDPIHIRYALSGKLSNIFRIKKGRTRICWIVSSRQRKVQILFISTTPRKAGDVKDPYELFTKLVMSGQYDEVFKQLGVSQPKGGAEPSVH